MTLNHQNVKIKFTASRINRILFQFSGTRDCFIRLYLKSGNYKEPRVHYDLTFSLMISKLYSVFTSNY
jgi:hypothetical protein